GAFAPAGAGAAALFLSCLLPVVAASSAGASCVVAGWAGSDVGAAAASTRMPHSAGEPTGPNTLRALRCAGLARGKRARATASAMAQHLQGRGERAERERQRSDHVPAREGQPEEVPRRNITARNTDFLKPAQEGACVGADRLRAGSAGRRPR